MKKLVFVLLAFFAIFAYIAAITDAEADRNKQEIPVEIEQ
jgi:hypothetical protein